MINPYSCNIYVAVTICGSSHESLRHGGPCAIFPPGRDRENRGRAASSKRDSVPIHTQQSKHETSYATSSHFRTGSEAVLEIQLTREATGVAPPGRRAR